MRAALAAGWRRRDLWWERLQERANAALAQGDARTAIRGFRHAFWLARLGFPGDDPRRAASLANMGAIARLDGADDRARRRYTRARSLWSSVPDGLDGLVIQPRARSSLFHLRMEVKHQDVYHANMKARLGAFVSETGECLDALMADASPPHRLHLRWRGEKPAVFDDTRKLLAACLLVASPQGLRERPPR